MKLIIDIPEKVVTAIQNGEDYRYDIHTAIAQGIPYEERPQGEWMIFEDNYGNAKPVCSCCHKEQIGYANYCSYCGAKMIFTNTEGGEEE